MTAVPFVKHFRRPARDEPEREWRGLTLLAAHTPGLAPPPLAYDPPAVTMGRIAGTPLRGTHVTPAQLGAMAAAVTTMHTRVPAHLLPALPWVATHPAVLVDELRAAPWPSPADALVARAVDAGRRWLARTRVATSPDGHTPVFGHGDGNLSNYLWDGTVVRIVDFEDSGRSDRAFELAEVVEHVSTWSDSHFDPGAFLARFALSPAETERLRECRRLNALAWLRILLHEDPAHPRNPPGTPHRQAARLLARLR